jgi:hypothetical protein
MRSNYQGLHKSFIAIAIRLIPFIVAIAMQSVSIIFDDAKFDLTIYIIINVCIWIMLISIINKTFLKYFLVGFDQTQYAINKKVSSGILTRLILITAAVLNLFFFVMNIKSIYLLALELILIIIADAIIEVRIRIYLSEEETINN